MIKNLLILISLFFTKPSFAQCPNILQAMVNSCGTLEGINEFVVFTTSVTANASTYNLRYGNSNPPNSQNLNGADAGAISGTGSVSASGPCSLISVTNPATSIPAGSRVIFIPSSLEQNYDVTGLCDGTNPLYVVYIKINGSGNSSWNINGNLVNSSATPRYLQVTYSGSSTCNGTNAPVKTYTATGGWPVLTGTEADGNFVTWQGTIPTYYNNGCTSIVVPISLLDFSVSCSGSTNIINWQTSQEINTANFEIERSYDGQNFTGVTSLLAAGNSVTEKNYRFVENNIQYKTTFYRLKSIDKDGKITFSKIVKITPSKNNISIGNVFPVPVDNILNIEWNSPSAGNSSISIMDVSGRMIKTTTIKNNVGFNKLTMDVAALPHGQYILKVVSKEKVSANFFTK